MLEANTTQRSEEAAATHSQTEAGSHLRANSGRNQIGLPLGIREATWDQHFSIQITPHLLNQVAASRLSCSQVKKHFA